MIYWEYLVYSLVPNAPVNNFIVDPKNITSQTASFNWEWDMNLNDYYTNTPMNGEFKGFKVGQMKGQSMWLFICCRGVKLFHLLILILLGAIILYSML